jgi:hypothetical protein
MPINRKTSLEELLKAGARELQELLNREPITVELRPLQAWALLGNLQLALTHERNKGATARIGRQVAKLLEREIATTPALKEIARRGWKGEGGDLVALNSFKTKFGMVPPAGLDRKQPKLLRFQEMQF